MRATVELDDDTSAAIAELRRTRSLGFSEAVNALIRRGMLARPDRELFVQQTRPLGARLDVSNVAEAIDALDPS